MSIHRRAARRDVNEKAIAAGLRAIGAEVWFLSGTGIGDLLVRFRGQLHCLEVKADGGKLTERQGSFPVVKSMDEALRMIGAMR